MSEVSRPTLRALLTLAGPIVLARATQSVIGFCDALFVAPLGEEPLAATTTGALDTFAAIVLPMGTVFILQSFVAQLRGRGELEATPRFAWYGLLVAALAGVLALCAVPFVPAIVARLDYAPRVRSLMSAYLGIRLLSVGPAVATEALGNWFGGLGRTRPSMIAGFVAMVSNVLGCYLFIEPRWGLPGYGVQGAAWASVGATVLGFLSILTIFVVGSAADAAPRPRGLRAGELLRVLRFGLPNGFNWFLEFAAFALFINVVVGHLGTTVLAAFNVVMQINSLSFMPAMGLASGGAILVGEAIGRRAPGDVWPIVRLTGIVAGAWMCSVGTFYALAPSPLMALFRPRDVPADALLHTGAAMLVFSAFWQLFDALSLTFGESLRAAGDTIWCMWARIVLAWVVFTPSAWAAIFVFGGGVSTVMTCLVVYVAVLSLTLCLRFASGRWRDIDLIGGATAPALTD
jgi:MATE family multidrug resistance protein